MTINRWENKESFTLPLEGETYTAYVSYNPQFETQKLRYVYNSLNTPSSVYEFDMEKKTQITLKTQEVMDPSFDPANYLEKRQWATARDGVEIPISLIYHKNTTPSADTPLLLYAYGSYGSTIDPNFSSTRLSLLDRGFIYANAHIRGGEYMGREWYETGKI